VDGKVLFDKREAGRFPEEREIFERIDGRGKR
jgi:hypothetical protein